MTQCISIHEWLDTSTVNLPHIQVVEKQIPSKRFFIDNCSLEALEHIPNFPHLSQLGFARTARAKIWEWHAYHKILNFM